MMLSLPDDWDYSVKGLVMLNKDGTESINSAIKELERFGYIKRKQAFDDNGRFCGYDYTVFEYPQTETPLTENPFTENPITENHEQLNTNTLNTKELNTKQSNTKSNREQVPYQRIIDSFNDICTSFPKVKSLSESRKKAIRARLNTYSVEQIIEAFRKAEASDFLKGKNNRDWQASFDWIMKDANIAKVLDGNYDNKGNKELYAQDDKDDPDYELNQQILALMGSK